MRIIRWSENPETPARERRVLVFGIGLIGSAVCRALRRTGAGEFRDFPFPWDDRLLQRKQAMAIESLCGNDPPDSIDVVWSAGSAGFSASARETGPERESFEIVLELVESLAARTPVRFHLVSSAGGLFEGQVCVSRESRPAPRRDYGELKLAQENLLRETSRAHPRLRACIYRPSTVYGPFRPGARAGLVSTLFLNGIANAATTIFGEPTTLRDLLWVDDLARHLVGNMRDEEDASAPDTVEVIASCRPCSVFELTKRVERILNASLYLNYSRKISNGLDITFLESAIPAGLRLTSIDHGLQLVYHSVVGTSSAARGGGLRGLAC